MFATAACHPAGTCRWSPSWGPRASEQAHLRARTPSPTPGLLSCFLPLSSTALPRTSTRRNPCHHRVLPRAVPAHCWPVTANDY